MNLKVKDERRSVIENLTTEDREYILDILHAAGWYEGRDYPIQKWLDTLARFGVEPFEVAVSVLREFGGLKVHGRFREDARFSIREIDFDPVRAGVGEEDRIQAWERFLKKRIYPLGEIDGDMLMITEDGSVYGLHPDGVNFFGSSIWKALHHLLVRSQKPTLIPGAPSFFYTRKIIGQEESSP